MAAKRWAHAALRPLAGAVGAISLASSSHRLSCEDKKPAFQIATCVRNEVHTHDTRLVTLKLPGNWNDKGPVANVLVRAAVGSDGKPLGRPYNPLSASSGCEVTLLVKRYGETAKMGSKLHGLQAGQTVEVKGPNKQWSLPAKGEYKNFGMVAGGTGLTPVIQATEAILAQDPAAHVTLVTLNKTSADVLLRKQLQLMEVKFTGRLTVIHCVGTKTGGKEDVATDLEGTASGQLLKALLPAPKAAGGTFIAVCGRGEMTAAVAGPKTPDYKQGDVGGLLKELGYATEQVWKF
eukprot:TRINITY_DN13417_c0_g1_i1.p1 TRINITY_DN13417_c0_g1~~TRINITY_DN13417_c0_g1_i1.p1  ORF type:complete len:292 (+),score=87.22 TRINITY_DN13417_c0_g1_i1:89-964(+)